jgi:hypothetical protein
MGRVPLNHSRKRKIAKLAWDQRQQPRQYSDAVPIFFSR